MGDINWEFRICSGGKQVHMRMTKLLADVDHLGKRCEKYLKYPIRPA